MPNERSFSWKFVLTFVGVVCVLGFVFAQLSGKLLFRQLAIHALAFSPDGKYLAASGVRYSKEAMGPGVLLVYEIGSKKLVLKEENLPSSLFQTAFSPDGQRLAVSYPRGRYVWDFRTKHWAEEKRMELPQSWPLGLIKDWLSVDDAKSWESRIKLLNSIQTNERQLVAVDTKGRLAATVNGRYSFEVWNLNPKKVLWKLGDQGTSTTRVAFSPNGKLLGLARQSAAGEPIYEVFRARSGKSVSQFHPAKNTHAIIFSRDGLLAATVGTGNQIEIWKADTGTLVTSFQIEGYNSR